MPRLDAHQRSSPRTLRLVAIGVAALWMALTSLVRAEAVTGTAVRVPGPSLAGTPTGEAPMAVKPVVASPPALESNPLTQTPAPIPAPVLPAPAAPAPVPGSAAVAPHRAIYRMSMATARNGSPVLDVRGKMMFQWADACDGWTTEQHFRLNFAYAEGEEAKTNTSYVSWEAKDGLSYRFNVRKTINGQLEEEVRGESSLAAEGGKGTASFVRPEESTLTLAPGVLFPTAHTLALIQAALAGERFFSRTVFDGADTDGATAISAVIGAPQAGPPPATPGPAEGESKAIASALLTGTAWPVRLAFFPAKGESSVPEYEMSVVLLANGVTRQLRIDYTDFSVIATLESLESLPRHGC